MVVQNSMSDSGTNSNRILSTETVMKMKEHITDSYGEVLYTHGTGCSGGAINSHTTMSVTPGLVDGFTVSCTFADFETTLIEVADCTLLTEAYQKPEWLNLMARGNAGGAFSTAQMNAAKAAINGHRDQSACQAWFTIQGLGVANMKSGNYFPRLVLPTDQDSGKITEIPLAKNNCELPASAVYDPVTNPSGQRCGTWDWSVSVFGKTADGKYTQETRDNTGVQYGLKALLEGKIAGELFVTLNEIIGGVDKDTNLVKARSAADAAALDVAYRSGLVANGANIAKHPQIDLRGYDDSGIDLPPTAGVPIVGVHQNWRSFAVRDRLDRDGGGHTSHALWRFGRDGFQVPPGDLAKDALLTMDNWLLKIKADKGAASIEKKIADAKPSSAADFCLLSSDTTQSVKVTDTAACDADPYLRYDTSPRQVAGGPRSEDVLKCQLRPINASDYAGRLSAPQLARLQAVFTGGVCDWSKPGVGQQAQGAVPLNFNAGPGGKPLPQAPVSTAL